MIMNDIDNIKIIRNIQKIKSKLDSQKFRDNEKDFILLIATHDYLKYIYTLCISYDTTKTHHHDLPILPRRRHLLPRHSSYLMMMIIL